LLNNKIITQGIKKMSGFSENITCPYCESEFANTYYESRGEMNGTENVCDICGYYEFQADSKLAMQNEKFIEPDKNIVSIAKQVSYYLDNIIPDNENFGDFFETFIYENDIPKLIKEKKVFKKMISVLFEF
jgi:hypothetical protein